MLYEIIYFMREIFGVEIIMIRENNIPCVRLISTRAKLFRWYYLLKAFIYERELLIRINSNTSMDKLPHAQCSVWRNYLSITKLQAVEVWMNKWFHPTFIGYVNTYEDFVAEAGISGSDK